MLEMLGTFQESHFWWIYVIMCLSVVVQFFLFSKIFTKTLWLLAPVLQVVLPLIVLGLGYSDFALHIVYGFLLFSVLGILICLAVTMVLKSLEHVIFG